VVVRTDGSVLSLDPAWAGDSLALLLAEGWEPVREHPMGGGLAPEPCSLVLLIRGYDPD
jgi:hypothetical protein